MPPDLFVHRDVLRRMAGVPVRPFEVAGWLLGFWADDESALFVTHATPPASRGTPLGVHVSGRGHKDKFQAAWDASEGAVTFLGDWHTHPGSPPVPSPTDHRALVKLASASEFGTPQPLIAIMSTPRWPWSMERTSQSTIRWQPSHGTRSIAFYLREVSGAVVALEVNVTDELPPQARAVPLWRWPGRRPSGVPAKGSKD